jgi:hypothetical protein
VELDKVYDGKYMLRQLFLAPPDEMTAQCNDEPTKSWVLKGEQPLSKKGVGRGFYHRDVICSMVGPEKSWSMGKVTRDTGMVQSSWCRFVTLHFVVHFGQVGCVNNN